MKRTLILTILFLLAAPAVVFAQPSVPGVRYVSVAPTGSCSQSPPVQVLNSSGAIYTCNNGTWAVQGGGTLILVVQIPMDRTELHAQVP